MKQSFVLLMMLALTPTWGQAGGPKVRWEYQTLTQSQLDKSGGLAKQGDDGWELIVIEPKMPKLSGFSINVNGVRGRL